MFCAHCGTKLLPGTRFCSGCGAKIEAGEAMPVPQTASPPKAAQPPRKNKWMNPLMILVAVILIFLGVGQLALTIVGRSITARVTGCEQVLYVNDDDSSRNPNRYKLDYTFSVNGKPYTGSVTRVFTGGSHMRQTIPVRYLSFWPHINAEDGKTMSLAGPVMIGLGALLIVITVIRTDSNRRTIRTP